MNLLFLYKYINLTLFAVFGNIQSSSSAPLVPDNAISFYNGSDKLTVLNSDNFLSTVYQSNTAWLIEFYASWCGHCKSYATIYREVAIDTWAWRTVVRIGAMNCYSGDNIRLCRQHKVRGYPTLQLIPPDAVFDNKSTAIGIPAADAKDVEKELIKGLENLNRKNRIWPRFIPVNRNTLEELYINLPKTNKLLFIIAEKRDDFTGRQIMLDFSKYQNQIAVFRTTTDGKFWRRFHLNITDVPALFVILRNRTAHRLDTKQILTNHTGSRNLFNYAIRSYILQTKSIENFDNDDIKEIIQSKKSQAKPQLAQINNNLTDDIRDKDTIYRKIHFIDLELALSYMLRHEIPQNEDIQGETYRVLIQWLTVLAKYFPGRQPVMAYLSHVLSKMNEYPNGLNADQFREIVDVKTSKAFLPDDHKEYQHCAGSTPQYRGYPCGLWLIFHTLTVSQYETAISTANPIDFIEIPLAVKNYVKYFFTCRECSDNFMKETADIDRLNRTNRYAAILYLWKIHNHVNQRLRNDASEDPQHPKVQFPSVYLCLRCQSMNNEHDQHKVLSFLIKYYAKTNIDKSFLARNTSENLSDQPERVIKKIDFIDQTGFFTHIFQHLSVYILFSVLIVLIIIRRRCCQTKGTRYQL